MTRLWIVLILLVPTPVWAWGEDGHVIVSKIAESYLTPEAKKQVDKLLDNRSFSDKRICIWADEIRRSSMYDRKYPNHRTWHYINLELQDKEENYKPEESGDHVFGAIKRFTKIMKDPLLDQETRKEGLMFVVHFVEDMHQPLHCSNRKDDKGGNMQPIKSFQGKIEEKLNLHTVWDTNLVLAEKEGLENNDFVNRLLAEIKQEHREAWNKGDVKDWIWESHMIGVKQVYKFTDGTDLPSPDQPAVELTEENYIKEKRPIVREQLKKTGVRLAKILNEAFAEKK